GEFVKFNPINLGPNWASSQEAALRVLALLFALSAFQSSATSTDQRMQSVASHVFQCAKRILITLDYARAQNNNHLLSEALGLILAGTFLADVTPLARSWLKLGFSVFEKGILAQLEPDGTYSQHSIIYHRMMLQLALLYYIYAQYNRHPLDMECHVRLCAATHWLAAQVDNESGDAPNWVTMTALCCFLLAL
ncbi:hypothetical protein EG834_18570, partial [bacterium]|nr:hypothetical protein [bacterium]